MADNGLMGFSFPRLAILKPAPLRKRLWQVAIALAIVLGTFTIGNFFVSPDKSVSSNMLGHDFLAFYTGGSFARTGQFDKLYDLEATRESEFSLARQSNLEIGKGFGPFWNPPFYAWLLAPYTTLPYRQALVAWTWTNLACLTIAIFMLIKMLPKTVRPQTGNSRILVVPQPRRDWRDWALVPLLVCCSMPFVQAISHGQNTFMSLMLLSFVVTAWRKNMSITAGLACGCMLYKPQLAAVVAGMMILSMGPRVLLGLGFVGGILLLVTARTMPDSIGNYLTQLPLNLKYMQVDHDYLWERHATLKAFWRLLFQGRGADETSLLVNLLTITSCGVIGIGLVGAWWQSRNPQRDDEEPAIAKDRLIIATITAMPLLMPFYFDYDLLLMSIPAVLIAAEVMNRPANIKLERMERLLIRVWFTFFAWLMFNPPIAGLSYVNVTVVLLSTICGLSIVRACQRGIPYPSVTMLPQEQRVTSMRAA